MLHTTDSTLIPRPSTVGGVAYPTLSFIWPCSNAPWSYQLIIPQSVLKTSSMSVN